MRVAGVVLCGGRSSRMGQPKAWLPFGTETMLQRTVRTLTQVVEPVIVVAAPGQDLPELPSCELVYDPQEHRGPLQGLAVGLKSLHGRADAAFVSACDTPFLQAEWVRFLLKQLQDFDIVVPKLAGYFHPLSAIYRTSLADTAETLLCKEKYRLMDLLEGVHTRVLCESNFESWNGDFSSLRNLNSWAEYQAALAEFENLTFTNRSDS
jgi:molybdenum cofactor guanylyltransferase